jgi:hypothetical protein
VWEAFQRNLREQSKKKGRTNFKAADTGTTPDPDSPDPRVFGPPGSESISHRHPIPDPGSATGSGSATLTIKRYFLRLDKRSDPSGSLNHLTPWPGSVIQHYGYANPDLMK